jgi:hypothetical protein
VCRAHRDPSSRNSASRNSVAIVSTVVLQQAGNVDTAKWASCCRQHKQLDSPYCTCDHPPKGRYCPAAAGTAHGSRCEAATDSRSTEDQAPQNHESLHRKVTPKALQGKPTSKWIVILWSYSGVDHLLIATLAVKPTWWFKSPTGVLIRSACMQNYTLSRCIHTLL